MVMITKKRRKCKQWQKIERWITIGDFSSMPGGGIDAGVLLEALRKHDTLAEYEPESAGIRST